MVHDRILEDLSFSSLSFPPCSFDSLLLLCHETLGRCDHLESLAPMFTSIDSALRFLISPSFPVVFERLRLVVLNRVLSSLVYVFAILYTV